MTNDSNNAFTSLLLPQTSLRKKHYLFLEEYSSEKRVKFLKKNKQKKTKKKKKKKKQKEHMQVTV